MNAKAIATRGITAPAPPAAQAYKQATSNWKQATANRQELRLPWEYAHAGSAVLPFITLCAVTLSTLLARD